MNYSFCFLLLYSTDDRTVELGNAIGFFENVCSSIDTYILNHVHNFVDGSECLKLLFGLQWSLLLPHPLQCLLVIPIPLVIRLEYVIDFFFSFLIAMCSGFLLKH